ncbi:hypothetical protein Tco_0435791 [Tanacetum coccineum]
MASHIWKLLTLKESLWVKWIHEYKLKGRNFWDYPMRGNMSWGWRKILRLRPVIRRFIWSKLGNGHATSLWFDKWSTLEPLANFVSSRDMARAGLSLKSKVSDVLVYGNWSWPNDLVTKYPILPNYNTPINNELDRLVWSDRFGNIQKFSVSQCGRIIVTTLSMTYAFVKRRTSESVGATACGGLRRLNYILARRIGWLFQKDKLKIMGWVVCSDAVVESCDVVLIFVGTASRCVCDAVSRHCREILDQCWCRIMNQKEIQQVAREEACVPKTDRVKISTTNMRIDPTTTQKEDTYQVVLDIIKNNTFYKAFLGTADVPEIYMQQFWHIVTKIKESTFYEFKLANKKCQFDVEVFCKALDICPRVYGKEFTVPPSKEEPVTFLIGFRYKGELTHLPKMFIDHMHQPCRTLASIINKCLLGKTTSNDRLRQSRKKVSISADDNIIPKPDVALELGKSMSLTEATEEEAARQVHATHELLVTEFDPEHARRSTRRRPSCIAFRDTSSVSKKTSLDQSQKLKASNYD